MELPNLITKQRLFSPCTPLSFSSGSFAPSNPSAAELESHWISHWAVPLCVCLQSAVFGAAERQRTLVRHAHYRSHTHAD